MKYFRHSLMSKYVIIIVLAIFIWPLFPAVYYFMYLWTTSEPFYEIEVLDKMWRSEAQSLEGASPSLILEKLGEVQDRYPQAEMFWVDASGNTHFVHHPEVDIPAHWSFQDLAVFYENQKEHQDIYTVTATVGNNPGQGLMIFQIPTSVTNLSMIPLFSNTELAILFAIGCAGIITVSVLFFLKLRRRLVRLRVAMANPGTSGVPGEVSIRKRDEIGELEKSFNDMVRELRASREREREEENLRRQFVAHISHDLRTPLTVIRQHAYAIQKNPASPQSLSSIEMIVSKLTGVDMLIDNLLSHTLLTAGKYPLDMKNIDILEEVRNAAAEWYPVFEAEAFEVDVNLPEGELIWQADPLWLRSMLDNLFQNVIRHAASGKYIGIQVIERKGHSCLKIKDKGKGMEHHSDAKGAGIGLSIVSLMARNMNFLWETTSSSTGTSVYIGKKDLNKT